LASGYAQSIYTYRQRADNFTYIRPTVNVLHGKLNKFAFYRAGVSILYRAIATYKSQLEPTAFFKLLRIITQSSSIIYCGLRVLKHETSTGLFFQYDS